MNTDWWLFGATLFSGAIMAIATITAVIYSNRATRRHVAEQQKELDKISKYVVVRPSMLLTTFAQILDKLIVSNDNNRVLLFSGEDGFDFFDNPEKLANYKQRVLQIENQSSNDIRNITLITTTELHDLNTDRIISYRTKNQAILLRGHESILIRMLNEEQFLEVCKLANERIGSELLFNCDIEYETLADQRVKYIYEVKIRDDKRIEIVQDGVKIIEKQEEEQESDIKQSIFRNLQDSISSVDRSEYAWKKMGAAQFSGILPTIQAMQPQTKPATNNNP